MKQERLMKVIVAPYMSEKASIGTEKRNEYAFEVVKHATKLDVKEAVELMFKTKVKTVHIVNVKKKPKRFGQIQGHSKPWKKAIVTLQAGESIAYAGA